MKYLPLDDRLYEYVVAHGHNADPLLAELARETEALGQIAVMQIAPEQGTFLSLLTRVMGARRAIEIGTFTGYSSICIARGLAPGGRLLCCDVNPQWTDIARRYWEKAGLSDRIELRLAPALETLASLPQDDPFDLAFIDADKTSYAAYYEALLPRLRPDGVIIFDNVLWSGLVVHADDPSEDTRALRALNDRLAADDRVQVVMLTVADGLTIARKKS